MGLPDQDLIMFNNDRSDQTYMKAKMKKFENGEHCVCGEIISKTNAKTKRKCTSNEALKNHAIFPTFSAIIEPKYDLFMSHWALLVEIHSIEKQKGLPICIIGFTPQKEFTTVMINQIYSFIGDNTFNWSDLKMGHTLALLYAQLEPSTKNVSVMVPNSCIILKESIFDLQEHAKKLLNDADFISRKEVNECFGCQQKCNDIKRCSGCKLAKYCSLECQQKDWQLCHKKLCSQAEVLLRLASLPRNQDIKGVFSFKLGESSSLPPYIYKSDMVQQALNGALIFEQGVVKKIIEKPKSNTQCSLCEKKNQEAYLANGLGLTKTNCCDHWICDDDHTYKLNSYLENSCYRNHSKQTICGIHYKSGHKGLWKSCKECKNDIKKTIYDDQSTNKYNFDKLTKIQKDEIWCRNCGFASYNLSDFSGSTPCCAIDDNYFCKKPACKRKGGFDQDNNSFQRKEINPFAKENEQRMVSLARSGINASFPFGFEEEAPVDDVDELTKQAEKMLKKGRFSPALRCLSLAIDKIILQNPLNKMEKINRIKLAKLYVSRAQCYLQMAYKWDKMRYANLASDDCMFLLNDKNLEKDLIAEGELVRSLHEVSAKSKLFIEQRKSREHPQAPSAPPTQTEAKQKQAPNIVQPPPNNNNNSRQNNGSNNQRRRNRRYRNSRRIYEDTPSTDEKETFNLEENDDSPMIVQTCAIMFESHLAINALSVDDQCPICYMQWCNFVHPSISVVLPCSHACCASCLLRFHEAYTNQEKDDEIPLEDKPKFCCVLCRKKLSPDLMQEVARTVVDQKLIPSFNEFAKKLPFSKEEFEDLIVSLLLGKFSFDISKVEGALFNMIGLVERESHEQLNFEQKQEYYATARAPVMKFQEEYSKLRQKLFMINDTDSVEWRTQKKELQDLQKKLTDARKNAASDIFERMNSRANMGAIIEAEDGTESGLVHVDLHGLHVNEAKERVNEFVAPILPALKRMIIITGHGVHNQTGSSVLKDNMKQYFSETLKLRCEDTKNKGALIVYA